MGKKFKSISAICMAICMAVTMSSTSLFAVVADAMEQSKIEQQVQDSEATNKQVSEEANQEATETKEVEKSAQDKSQQKSKSVATEAQQNSEEASKEEKVEDQITIKVPKEATLFVGTKTVHYVAFKEVKPDRDPTTEDGVTTYAFNDLASGQIYNLRVSMEGKVTYCDYFKPNKGTVFTFRTAEDSENPDSDTVVTLKDDPTQVIRGGMGSDIYINVGSTGQKNLKVGEEFKLRNYRVWQNITDGVNNYFFEPDFHYEIISGSDVISYNQETSKIKALKEGTAIVKITYDAQEITSLGYAKVKNTLAKPSERNLTSAIWPENVGLFVVKVGSNGEIDNGIKWDAEHDSYYYINSINGKNTGETNAKYTFEPEEGSTVTVLRPTLNDAKTSVSYSDNFSAEGVSTKDGKVTVTLNHGRNIIKVEKDGKATYQVITARPLDLTVQDKDGNQIESAKPGQKINIIYNGISTPVYKMSGIYNPNTNYIEYSSGATGDNIGQYLAGKMNLNVTIPAGIEDNTYTVSGKGKICVTLWGDKVGEGHRENIGDEGRQPNLNASTESGKFSVLPEITIPVDTDAIQRTVVTFNNFPENGYIIITDSNSSTKYTKNIVKLPAGDYSYTVGAKGYKAQRGTFTVSEEALNLNLKDMEAVDSTSKDNAWNGLELSEPEKKDGVYQIKTGAELAWFANEVTKGNQNAKALLLNDIDLAEYDWTPIGEFYGSFDGGNHTIKNLYVKNASYSSALFSYLGVGGVIKNLTVDGDVITDTVKGSSLYTSINTKRLFYTSGIVAEAKYATIENCRNNVDVTVAGELAGGIAYETTKVYIGGVVGNIYNSVVKNCINTGNINVTSVTNYSNTNSGIGGVIGYSISASTIKNCGNEGNITSLALINKSPYSIAVGGLVGLSSYSYNIENCYNKGTVKSNSSYGIGGISGFIGSGVASWTDKNGNYVSNQAFYSKINNCYNTGNIIGTNTSSSAIGGIVGNANIYGMKNTYNLGNIETASTNTSKVGAFIGSRSKSDCNVSDYTNNYYKKQNDLNVIGYNDDANISRTEIVDESTVQPLIEANESNYCGYDGIYPMLYWEVPNMTELKVVKQPKKLNYYLNTSLDTDGMMLLAKDSSGKEYNVNGYSASISPNKFEVSGKQKVTISFAGAKTEIDVNVYEEGKKAEFVKLPEVDKDTTNIITIQKGTGEHKLVFEADGKGEVEYKLYRANDINSSFESISFAQDKRQLILEFYLSNPSSYLYKVEATIGEEVIETQTYLVQVVDKNTECTINYEQPKNGKMEITDIAGNTIKSGSKIYAGKKLLPKLAPDEGYAVSKYQGNGEYLNYNISSIISTDTTFTVEYGKEHTVTFESTSIDENKTTKGIVSVRHGVNTINSGDKVGEGAILDITINAKGSGNSWYVIDDVDITATLNQTIADTYTNKQSIYTVADKDVNITAKYSLGSKITLSNNVSTLYNYSYDDVVEKDISSATFYLPAGKVLKVTPRSTSDSYQITEITFKVSGANTSTKAEIGDDYSATFTTIGGNTYKLMAKNSLIYKPNISITGEGRLQILNEAKEEIEQFTLNSKIIVNGIPADGYKLVSIKNGSSEITPGTVFKPTTNRFTVVFEKDETKWSKVTFDADNGQDSVVKEIKKDQSLDYTPEVPVKEGYTFVGWYKDTDDVTTEYKNNQSYAEDTTYKAKWAHVSMLGAQGKLVVNDKSGIRFGTKLYNDGDEIVEKGTLIIPASMLDEGEALTLNTPKAAKSIGKINYEVNKDENYVTYLGTIVNIPKAQFETQMTASAYVTYKDKAGNKYTVYAPYANGSISVLDILGNYVDWNEQW